MHLGKTIPSGETIPENSNITLDDHESQIWVHFGIRGFDRNYWNFQVRAVTGDGKGDCEQNTFDINKYIYYLL